MVEKIEQYVLIYNKRHQHQDRYRYLETSFRAQLSGIETKKRNLITENKIKNMKN